MTEAQEPRVILEAGNLLGESPVWDERHAALWWVDIHGHRLHRWRAATGHDVFVLAEQTACIGLCEDGRLVCGGRFGFAILDPASGQRTVLEQPLAGTTQLRFNDGRCDRGGRFWSGTVSESRTEGAAALYRLDPDGHVSRRLEGVTVSNGLAFSPDNRSMYFADSHRKEMYVIDFDLASGALGERRRFVQFEADWGMPDGATVDAEGCVWVAGIGGSRVLRFDPTGRLVSQHRMPVTQPTSCQFGGPDLRTLFVTSARMRLGEAELASQPLAGSLFAIEPGVNGLPEPRFRQGPSA